MDEITKGILTMQDNTQAIYVNTMLQQNTG